MFLPKADLLVSGSKQKEEPHWNKQYVFTINNFAPRTIVESAS